MDYALKSVIRRTVSLSWRIGRAVTLAQKQANISNVGQIVIDAVGGSDVGKVLFEGKIVGVERRTMRGHSHGEVTIEALASNEEDDSMKNKPKYEGRIGSRSVFWSYRARNDCDSSVQERKPDRETYFNQGCREGKNFLVAVG